MKMKDHSLYFGTAGKQLSFALIMAIVCAVGFFILDVFEKAGWLNVLFAALKGIFAVGAVYLTFYSINLSKKLTEKHYK